MSKAFIAFTIIAIVVPNIGARCSVHTRSPTTQAAEPLTVQEEYRRLLEEIKAYNAEGIDSWTMNSEHLFVGVGDLRDRVISFVRREGTLDLLFATLIDERVGDAEVLAIAELLVYFGQYDQKGDESILSTKAPIVAVAIDKGRLGAAEKRFPGIPIKSRIMYAVQKSIRNAKAAASTTRRTR
jgi:hypothetical protein